MSDYQQLTARFAEVRGAWKRTAALSGLAVVVTEGIGILTVLLFLDWLYQPRTEIRVCMWVAALVGIAWFLARQVLAPISRRISDEQIALYIEEHRNDLDGVLITAAEYGRRRDYAAAGQAGLIDMLVAEAASRAHSTAGSVIDFSRLRKYGIAAAAGVGIYILLSALFPQAIAHHVGRVLNPWHLTEEDMPKGISGPAALEPIHFVLSKGDASLVRGASFDFEATLSRHPDKPVTLNFRPAAQGGDAAWQPLPMTEIEKLNGFQGNLSDVSEDLDYYVSCGTDRSETHHLKVFDPLVVQSIQVTTHYPAYTKLPDRIEKASSGDIEALVDSTVTVRIATSNLLKEGQVKWDGGATQPFTVDSRDNTAATFSFQVKADTTYDYALTDANGQKAASVASLSVKAVPDNPPTVKLVSPQSPLLTNPLGEVKIEVDADDDFGVAGVDLILARVDDNGDVHETRMPLTLVPGNTAASPNAVHSTYLLQLEKGNPAFKSEEALSYHVEARDTKGQITSSDMGLIIIGYFEDWAVWGRPHAAHNPTHQGPDLYAMLSLTWTLNLQKRNLAPADFKEQSKEVADQMVDTKTGEMRSFVDLIHMPKLARVADKIALLANSAHNALLNADTAAAANDLRYALILYASNALRDDTSLAKFPPATLAGSTSQQTAMPSLTMLEKARLDAATKDAAKKANAQQQQKQEGKANAAAADEIQALVKKQEDLIAEAKKPEEGGKGGGAKGPAELGKAQKDIAEETKAVADKANKAVQAAANAPSKLTQTAAKVTEAEKAMEAAAQDFNAGRKSDGAAKAETARKDLLAARDVAQGTDRDKLEIAISQLASELDGLIEKQDVLRGDTETTAKELDGGKTPDQRQTRDLQKQAYQETGMQAEAESIMTRINDLNTWATQVGEAEAIRALGEAVKTVRRTRPEGKMAGAVIDLNNGTPVPAADEQASAEDSMKKILEDLHQSSDALAASREAQLRRAQRAAKEASRALQQLAGKQAQKGTQPAAQAGTQQGAQQAAYNVQRLAANLNNRDLVPQQDADRLAQMSADKVQLEQRLKTDPKTLKDVSELVADVEQKLEAETTAKTEARKLFSSQREECPPEYRQYVNQYFEALSKMNGAAAPAGQP